MGCFGKYIVINFIGPFFDILAAIQLLSSVYTYCSNIRRASLKTIYAGQGRTMAENFIYTKLGVTNMRKTRTQMFKNIGTQKVQREV